MQPWLQEPRWSIHVPGKKDPFRKIWIPTPLRDAWELVGGLSSTSKMPGPSYSLPALDSCPTGSQLARVPGTPCATCYAVRGNYRYRNVHASQMRRLEHLRELLATGRHYDWVTAMARVIPWACEAVGDGPWFRIHDSGDFFAPEYLSCWLAVAIRLPQFHFWAPTQESTMVMAAQHLIPDNLTLRLSAKSVDRVPPLRRGMVWSMVYTQQLPASAQDCPARSQGGRCAACRACWSDVSLIGYHRH